MKNVKHTSIIKRHWNSYAKRGFSLQKKNKNRMLYKWSFQQKDMGKK
jgi:hypothetical protein